MTTTQAATRQLARELVAGRGTPATPADILTHVATAINRLDADHKQFGIQVAADALAIAPIPGVPMHLRYAAAYMFRNYGQAIADELSSSVGTNVASATLEQMKRAIASVWNGKNVGDEVDGLEWVRGTEPHHMVHRASATNCRGALELLASARSYEQGDVVHFSRDGRTFCPLCAGGQFAIPVVGVVETIDDILTSGQGKALTVLDYLYDLDDQDEWRIPGFHLLRGAAELGLRSAPGVGRRLPSYSDRELDRALNAINRFRQDPANVSRQIDVERELRKFADYHGVIRQVGLAAMSTVTAFRLSLRDMVDDAIGPAERTQLRDARSRFASAFAMGRFREMAGTVWSAILPPVRLVVFWLYVVPVFIAGVMYAGLGFVALCSFLLMAFGLFISWWTAYPVWLIAFIPWILAMGFQFVPRFIVVIPDRVTTGIVRAINGVGSSGRGIASHVSDWVRSTLSLPEPTAQVQNVEPFEMRLFLDFGTMLSMVWAITGTVISVIYVVPAFGVGVLPGVMMMAFGVAHLALFGVEMMRRGAPLLDQHFPMFKAKALVNGLKLIGGVVVVGSGFMLCILGLAATITVVHLALV